MKISLRERLFIRENPYIMARLEIEEGKIRAVSLPKNDGYEKSIDVGIEKKVDSLANESEIS